MAVSSTAVASVACSDTLDVPALAPALVDIPGAALPVVVLCIQLALDDALVVQDHFDHFYLQLD